MPRPKFVYLTAMSGIWKVSRFKYRQMLNDISDNQEINLDDYGKYIGSLESVTVTDLTPDEADELLEDFDYEYFGIGAPPYDREGA